jgi:hypothetical protein
MSISSSTISREGGMVGALESWAMELHVRADRVRQLIGSAHWLSDGHHKEYILVEFLTRHLPFSLTVGRGFVRAPDPEVPVSGEIDILITDSALHPPWFREGGMTIAPPESVVGQIHVKTGFGRSELTDVIGSIAATTKMCVSGSSQVGIWSGGYFYRQDLTVEGLDSILKQVLRSQIEAGIGLECLQCCIAVYGGIVVLIGVSGSGEGLRVRVLQAGNVATAILMAALCSHLRAIRGHTGGMDAFSSLLSRVDFPMLYDFTLAPERRGDI